MCNEHTIIESSPKHQFAWFEDEQDYNKLQQLADRQPASCLLREWTGYVKET
jgi:hypothetical protein